MYYKVLKEFRMELDGAVQDMTVDSLIDLTYETAKIFILQGWVKKADAADRIAKEHTADRAKIQQGENNMDWMCAKAIIIHEAIHGLRDVCNGLGSPELVPWLEKLSDMQGALIDKMRDNTSYGFGYSLSDDLPHVLEYYKKMNAPECYKETWAREDLQWLRETHEDSEAHKGQSESMDTLKGQSIDDDIPGFPSTENKNHCDGCCHYAEHPFAAENPF